MKKTVLLLVYAGCVLPLWGQAASSSIRVSTAVAAPESTVDLLKESIHKSSSTISGVSTPKAVAPSAKSAEKPAPAATPANTLDMPLEVGGQTQTVQTAVTPVKKQSSAKTRRTTTAKQKPAQAASNKQTSAEQAVDQNNSPSSVDAQEPQTDDMSEEDAADAELEYAVKMLEESKAKAESTERSIPPSAAQNKPSKVPAPNKKFNPNAFRPGVTWLDSKSSHFDIYTQKRTSGIPSSNMAMTFENAYQTLRRFIPWMMAGRVRVFVYQDHQSYLRHEPNAKAWTRAIAYPTRGEVVVYDEPGKQRELQEVFTHELTHIFTQQFFDSHKTGRIMTPTWLDEGLAVFMEDQMAGPKGGPWAHDFNTLNFQRDPSENLQPFKSTSIFGTSNSALNNRFGNRRRGKPVYLVPFEQFMDEGSLQMAEARNQVQNWYFQAYAMVRFLLNPAGSSSPSNRMLFEQFTRLISQGEAKRDPETGFLVWDARGKTVYEPYSVEKALGKAFRYNTPANFEDNFWRWAGR